MDGLVMFIGWTTIIIGLIFALGSLAERSSRAKFEATGEKIEFTNMTYRLAARKIYFDTSDENIREKVKSYANMYLSGWTFLELDMSDEEYREKHDTYLAEQIIMNEGYPPVLVDEEIVPTWQLDNDSMR